MGGAAPSKIPQKVDDSTIPSIKDVSNESYQKEENIVNIGEKLEWGDQKREYIDIKKTKSSTKEWNDSLKLSNEAEQKNITPIKPKYDTNFTTPPIKQKPTPPSKPRPPPNKPQSIITTQTKSKTPSRNEILISDVKNSKDNQHIKVDPISTQMSLEIKQEYYDNSLPVSRMYTPDQKEKNKSSQSGIKIISKVKQCVDGNVDDSDSDIDDYGISDNGIDDNNNSSALYDWTLSQTQGPSTHPDIKIPSTPIKSDQNNDYTKDYSIVESKQFFRSVSEKDDEFIGDFRNYDYNLHDDYVKPDIVPLLNLSADISNHSTHISQHHNANTMKFSSVPMTGNNGHNIRNTINNIPPRIIMQKPGFGPSGRGPGPARGPPNIRPTIVTASPNRTITPSNVNQFHQTLHPHHQHQQLQQQQQQQQLLIPPQQQQSQSHTPQHQVKETNDVKRNRAQLPSTLTHAQPTTGDWLKKRYIVNNYILLDLLGTGSYGEVKLCKDRTTDKLYAMKIFAKEMLKKRKGGNTSETYFEDIKREIAIMKKLSHPNVLKLFEVLDDPKVNKMYLVLEYMKRGDLIKFLKNRDNIDEKDSKDIPKRRNSEKLVTLSDVELKVIFTQVVAGVKYLHFQNIIHGDIKPQNILVGDDNIVKIADFGISKMLENGSAQKLVDAGGTPAFMAPELCSATAEAFSGQLADIWAIGATMYMLRFGQPPFVASNVLALYNKIINDPLEFPQISIDPGLKNLLVNMLEKDPKLRYNMDQITSHPWLRYAPRPNTTLTFLNQQSDTLTSTKSEKQVLQLTDKYFNDEAEAMKGPKKTVDREDIYRSIGYGIESKHRGDDSVDSQDSTDINIKDNDNDNKKEKDINKEDEYEDIMATNWASDVFEQVDDPDLDSNDDDDDEVDDDDDDDNEVDVDNGNNGNDNYSDSDSNSDDNDNSVKNRRKNNQDRFKNENNNKNMNEEVNEDEIKTPILKQTQSKLNMDEKEQDRRSKDFKSKLLAKTSNYQLSKLSSKESVDVDDTDDDDVNTSNNNNNNNSISNNNSGSIKRKSPSKNKNRKKSVDIGSDPVEELSMDDFEEMMDTLAMRPAHNSNKGKSEPINAPFLISNILLHSNSMNLNNGIGGVSYSDQGCRRTQEDSVVLMLNYDVNNSQINFLRNNETLQSLSIAAIFDGHNGGYCSKYLSKKFVSILLENPNIFSYKTLKQAMIETCQQIDLEVCKELKRLNDSSGSTGVIVLYDGRSRRFTVANVGDSKCILCRCGYAVEIHRTHRVGDHEDEIIRIQKAGGSVVNRRVNGVLAISRAFGDTAFKDENDIESSLVLANPDVYSEIITPMTEFCVIASDGLWDVMDSQVVVNYIRERINDKYDLEDIVRELVNDTIEKGSIDNVSIIILIFHLDKVSPTKCDLPTIDSLSKIQN